MTEKGLVFSQGRISGSQSTVISIVPFPITETKPGLIPGEFHLDASRKEEPVCLPITDSIFYVYIDSERGNLKVPAPSYQVAKSICFDYLTAQMEVKEDCYPGLFWKEGIWTPERVKVEATEDLAFYSKCQYNWFIELIERADDDWEKTRVHYAISDIQRYALRAVDPKNSKNRPWLIAEKPDTAVGPLPIHCPACGSEVLSTAVVCRHCQYVLDRERYSKMTFAAPHVGEMNLDDVVRK